MVVEHHEMNYYNLFVIIIPALFYILLQKALEINIKKVTAVPYIFEIVIFVLLFELALIVFLNYPFPVFPFR